MPEKKKISLVNLKEGDEIEMKGVVDPEYNGPATIRRYEGRIVIYVPDDSGGTWAAPAADVDAKRLVEWLKENTDLIG